jgi:hypothetical protein
VCGACTTIIGIVIDALENGLEEAAIDALVDAACMALPPPFDVVCSIAFDASMADIIESIAEGVASDAICDSIGLCGAAGKSAVSKAARKSKNSAISKVLRKGAVSNAAGKSEKSAVSNAARVKAARKSAVSNAARVKGAVANAPRVKDVAVAAFVGKMPGGVVCDACKEIVNMIVEKLAEGLSEAAIEALVDAACMGLPPPFDVACAVAFDAAFSEIIDLIVEGSGVSSICGHIGLCSAPAKVRRAPARKAFVKQAPADIFCDICQEVVDYVAELIVNGTIGPVLEELVAEFCDLFPWPVSSLCQSFADQYLDEIIADIEAGIEDICSLIGICAAPAGAERVRVLRVRPVPPRRPRVETIKKVNPH